jgi:hypothetical protein
MVRSVWYRIFLDSDLVEKVFAHVRNVFYCSLILAVGLYTHDHPPDFLLGTSFDPYWGYPLIGIGFFLFLLNLVDSLNRIPKSNYPSLVKIFVFSIHVVVTGWLAIVVLFFRMK